MGNYFPDTARHAKAQEFLKLKLPRAEAWDDDCDGLCG